MISLDPLWTLYRNLLHTTLGPFTRNSRSSVSSFLVQEPQVEKINERQKNLLKNKLLIHHSLLPHPCRLAQAHSLHSLTIRFAYRRGLASSASLLSLNTRLVPPLTPHTRFTTFTRVWGRGPLIESLMKLLTKWGPHVLPLHSLHSFCSLTRGAGGTTPVTFPTLTSLTVVPPLARAQALALGSVPLTSPTGATPAVNIPYTHFAPFVTELVTLGNYSLPLICFPILSFRCLSVSWPTGKSLQMERE